MEVIQRLLGSVEAMDLVSQVSLDVLRLLELIDQSIFFVSKSTNLFLEYHIDRFLQFDVLVLLSLQLGFELLQLLF